MAIEDLIENVDSQIIKIRTKSLDVSFNELYDMYKNGTDYISRLSTIIQVGRRKAVPFCGIFNFGDARSSHFRN